MTQVKRFIGIWRGIFNHHKGRILGSLLRAEVVVLVDGLQQLQPGTVAHTEVQETLYHVELLHSRTMLLQVFANLLGRLFGALFSHLHEWEDHQCQVSLKLTSRLLQLHHFLRGIHVIESLHGILCSLADQCFNIHDSVILAAKVRKIK